MRHLRIAFPVALALLASGCLHVKPYARPAITAPAAFKEAPPEGWKEATPNDGLIKGKWWEIFGDPALNALEEQVNISNQNVLQAEANYEAARAAVRISRSALYPTVAANPGATGSLNSARSNNQGFTSGPTQLYTLPISASWTLDLWGAIRRSVTAAANTAQSFEAALENARLLYQSELAQDYFQLHGTDADYDLLQETVKSYADFLTLTRNRYAGGVASDGDVAQAETQLEQTQASLIDVEVQRTQLEHAIAVLTGKPPANLTIPHAPIQVGPPRIPVGVPSALLERRPDVAEAERQASSANQQIGIAQAAFYPSLTLGASVGVTSTKILDWIAWPSRFWSLGPQLAYTIFDAGKRSAQVVQAQAQFDASAANYRQTVLTAFQQVEDNLGALRILEQEAAETDKAVSSAQRSLTVTTAQYKAGTADYLQVIQTQTIALGNERTAVALKTRRMTASVLLIQALGGGWDASQLPTTRDVGAKQ